MCTYTHGAEFLMAAARFRDFHRMLLYTRYGRLRGSNIGGISKLRWKICGVYSNLLQRPVFRGIARYRLFSAAIEENQRLSRKFRYLYSVMLHTTCTSVLRNYLKYYRLEWDKEVHSRDMYNAARAKIWLYFLVVANVIASTWYRRCSR